ncbi:MAG: hypothetical protein ACTSR8_02485 [Promethearchaeota archaeon]
MFQIEVQYDATKRSIQKLIIDKKGIDILTTKFKYKTGAGKTAYKYVDLFDLYFGGQEITAKTKSLRDFMNQVKNNAKRWDLKGMVFKRSTNRELTQLKAETITRIKEYFGFEGEIDSIIKKLAREMTAITEGVDPEIQQKDGGSIFDFIKRKSVRARSGALNTGKSALKDSLFETLLEHHADKEILYKDYVRYLEETGKVSREWFDNYAPLWESPESQLVQRLVWGIAFEFRHPLTGEQMNWREWMSYPLHHWMTGEGHENKLLGLLAGVMPITKEGEAGHMDITTGVEYQGKGQEYEDAFKANIIDVLNGKVPDNWKKKTPEQKINMDKFRRYLQRNEETTNIIKWFVLTSHMDILSDVDTTSMSTDQILGLMIARFRYNDIHYVI